MHKDGASHIGERNGKREKKRRIGTEVRVKSEERKMVFDFDPKKNARFGKWMEREHFDASRWIPP